MVEQMLRDFDAAYRFRSVCLRYFNAAGTDPQGRLGEDHMPETHLIPLTLFTALGQRPAISVFGADYPTPDGTCVRDYVHVADLAQAHVLGLEYLLNGGSTTVFNLGSGSSFSVKSVIETACPVTNREIPVITGDRRPGDAPMLVSRSDCAYQVLGWTPMYSNLEQIITHAWNWHQSRHSSVVTVCS